MSRPRRQNLGDGRAVDAHETAHFLHAELRNARPPQGPRVNCFYLLGGKGVEVEEPPMRLSRVPPLVPASMRGYRYKLYLVDQVRGWDDRSLYLFDEGFAYLIDSLVSLDDLARRTPPGPLAAARDPARPGAAGHPVRVPPPAGAGSVDGVSSCLEFSIYLLAHALAVRAHAPEYWAVHGQYRQVLGWFLDAASRAYAGGASRPEFAGLDQGRLLAALRESPEAGPFRDLLKAEFRGIWLA
jgi:hypothetical protein